MCLVPGPPQTPPVPVPTRRGGRRLQVTQVVTKDGEGPSYSESSNPKVQWEEEFRTESVLVCLCVQKLLEELLIVRLLEVIL